MPRHSRAELNASFFHVICQGINKEYIFEKKYFKDKYYQLMKQYIVNMKLDVLSYCIMDNHVHILIYTESTMEMSVFMRRVNTKFANYYNYREGRVGFVFRDRFKSQPIDNLQYLYQCINYIHLNPVKAGMTNDCSLYQYSSYKDFKNGKLLSGRAIDDLFNHAYGDDNQHSIPQNEHDRMLEYCNFDTEGVGSVVQSLVFLDVDCNKDDLINECILNFCEQNHTYIEAIKKDRAKRDELIRAMMAVKGITKRDVQRALDVGYWIVAKAVKGND